MIETAVQAVPNAAEQPSARTRASQARFLKVFGKTANITSAAKAAKVGRTIVYVWQEHDPEFAVAMQQAREEAYDRLEGEALRRAVEGLPRKRPIFSNGQIVDWEVYREYSDRMLELLLKASRPEKYRERYDVTTGGQPIVKAYAAEDLELLGATAE
jgi:hypothetical protein